MPIFYSILPAQRVVLSGGRAPLSFTEMLEHAERLRHDPRFDPGMSQVVDFRGVKLRFVGAEGVRTLATINPFGPEARRAVLVDSSLIFGLIRMYQALTNSDPARLRLFSDPVEAYEWLGLDPAIPWPDPPDATFTAPADPAES